MALRRLPVDSRARQDQVREALDPRRCRSTASLAAARLHSTARTNGGRGIKEVGRVRGFAGAFRRRGRSVLGGLSHGAGRDTRPAARGARAPADPGPARSRGVRAALRGDRGSFCARRGTQGIASVRIVYGKGRRSPGAEACCARWCRAGSTTRGARSSAATNAGQTASGADGALIVWVRLPEHSE